MKYADGVTLITCTGDRPEAFVRCRQFVERQTFEGRLQWLIVNDGMYTNGYVDRPKWREGQFATETHIFPEPKWKPGQNTLARNLLAAIPEVTYSKVLFFEDDDHVKPDYVARMAFMLNGDAAIVGDPNSLYYHLPSHRYRVMKNGGSASLCQTGIRAELLPVLERVCKDSPDYIDFRLWQTAQPRLLTHVGGVMGMKGLPGRPGIGVGHRPDSQAKQWSDDSDLSVLTKWIGAEDIELYREFL